MGGQYSAGTPTVAGDHNPTIGELAEQIRWN